MLVKIVTMISEKLFSFRLVVKKLEGLSAISCFVIKCLSTVTSEKSPEVFEEPQAQIVKVPEG